MPNRYEALTDFVGVDYLNAGDHVTTDGVDGIHLTAEANIALGRAVADKVRTILR